MDASLLQLFTEAVRGQLERRAITALHYCRPVLSVAIGRREPLRYLSVILESPGPFCYLSDNDPLRGVPAPAPFPGLLGATITGVERPQDQRILCLNASPAGERAGALVLRLFLFGSAGRVELTRPDGTPLQYVGAGRTAREGSAPPAPSQVPAVPFFLVSVGRIGRVAPTRLDDPGAPHRFGPFDDVLAACREVGATILAQAHDGMIRSRLRPLTKRIGTRRSLLAKLRAERLRADDHASLRREAETLAAYQASIRPGARSVDLPDVYAPDRILRIELDPSQPLPVQIEKRFKMAAKLERRRAHADRRIEEVTREIETLEGDVTAVEEAAGFAAAMGEIERIERARPSLHRGERAPHDRSRSRTAGGPEGIPYRRFELDEMWFVLVGRNNRENDELTFRTAAPSDLWFHAQHVAGSHVVLKARGNPGAPPTHILEAAAAIAAHFSKSRHSGLAPVIYTQRKYVRKFRGAKPGQVVCEREKTIVVAPRLPRTDS